MPDSIQYNTIQSIQYNTINTIQCCQQVRRNWYRRKIKIYEKIETSHRQTYGTTNIRPRSGQHLESTGRKEGICKLNEATFSTSVRVRKWEFVSSSSGSTKTVEVSMGEIWRRSSRPVQDYHRLKIGCLTYALSPKRLNKCHQILHLFSQQRWKLYNAREAIAQEAHLCVNLKTPVKRIRHIQNWVTSTSVTIRTNILLFEFSLFERSLFERSFMASY